MLKEVMACGWEIIFLHSCSNDLIRIQSLHILHVLSHPYRGEVARGWGMEGGGVQREALIQCGTKKIVHLTFGHLTKWEISSGTEAPFLRILAATSSKTTVSLLNNHLCVYLGPLHETENHPAFRICSFPSLPDLPPSLHVCLSALSCCCFQAV